MREKLFYSCFPIFKSIPILLSRFLWQESLEGSRFHLTVSKLKIMAARRKSLAQMPHPLIYCTKCARPSQLVTKFVIFTLFRLRWWKQLWCSPKLHWSVLGQKMTGYATSLLKGEKIRQDFFPCFIHSRWDVVHAAWRVSPRRRFTLAIYKPIRANLSRPTKKKKRRAKLHSLSLQHRHAHLPDGAVSVRRWFTICTRWKN